MTLPAYEKLGAFYLGRKLDPSSNADTDELVLYDSRDLTTHAVCVGMTGSGKTGLCLTLIEEAAIDGVPAIVIDPKGDLANLLLTFPELRTEDFAPWVDAGEAARKGMSASDFAQNVATTWKKGLADWQQDGERIRRLRDAAEFVVYTPGSRSGRPLSILRSFAPPEALDASAVKERVSSAVSGLLALVGVEGDPLKSREHIFLSNLIEHAWRDGNALDLAGIIQGIQRPPFDKVGVLDLETMYPAKERLQLAMAINNLLAAPGFDAWLQGETLDAQRLLFDPKGKPRIAIVSIAHLSDAERMFVVTLLLNEVVAWMRKQTGTSSLRALVYMDEIFGYFPPTSSPPSKLPLLTLMKQARAFGVGVVLATQNPVDLDYKGLGNAGTWFIGRLQTERDKARVIEGLLSAAGEGIDQRTLERMMANLTTRVFLLRNAKEDAPVLMRTRWTLSYLRGPMTLAEIQKLSAPAESAPSAPQPVRTGQAKPLIPAGIREHYLAGDGHTYVPYVYGEVRAHFVDGAKGIDAWQVRSWLAPMNDEGTAPDWSAAKSDGSLKDRLTNAPVAGVAFADAPAALSRAQNYAAWQKELADFAYRTASLEVLRCPDFKLSSNVGESEGDFRSRIALAIREKRDAAIDKLRSQCASRITTLTDQIRRAQERKAREQSQLTQQRISAAVSVGSAILGAFLGRKAISSTTLSRAGTAMRSAGRMTQESADVARANESLEVLQQRLTDLQAELESDTARLQRDLDPVNVPVEMISIKARKSDTVATSIGVVWVPVGSS